jgi:hypothetical protein
VRRNRPDKKWPAGTTVTHKNGLPRGRLRQKKVNFAQLCAPPAHPAVENRADGESVTDSFHFIAFHVKRKTVCVK